mgnify:CR=1 FL=1
MDNKLSPIRLDSYQPLREVVCETLRDAIRKGILRPGERLMEIQLAEELGVSRTPVREAIRKLELEGYVIMMPRRGTYVANLSIRDVNEVFEIRTSLDSLASGLAAERITDEELESLQRLLVLNAGCHGDTLDDVLTSFKTAGSQQAILSKVDEAVKLGPSIDALIRHQMVLRGVTNGQRVPEDWEAAEAHKLISASMRAPVKSAFDPKSVELNYYFSNAPEALSEKGLVDA